MKLAVIVNTFPELSETFISNHIAGELLSGVETTVFSAYRPLSPKHHEAVQKYALEEKTVYADIPRNLVLRTVKAVLVFLRLLIADSRMAFEALRFGKYQTAAISFKLLFFGLCFRDKTFDAVHCHFGMNGLVGLYLKNCGRCDRLVTTFHGADINSYIKKHGPDVYRTLFRSGEIITANTAFTKSKIIQNGGPKDVRVIPAGLFFDDFCQDARTVEKIPLSILTVGRLEEKKGYRYSLAAVAEVKKTFSGVRYFIAGDGSLRKELEELAAELSLDGNCRFLGPLSGGEIREYYRKCEIFVLASVTARNGDMEGQGLVLQEAQASGVPVISTLHNGIPDGVLENTSGFLVPEKDSTALAEKIMLLFGDPGLREKMGKAGIEFVRHKYDIPLVVKQYNKCYRGLPE
jgi:colanic acid/amylovoran biosynthesis glycosyltransferase